MKHTTKRVLIICGSIIILAAIGIVLAIYLNRASQHALHTSTQRDSVTVDIASLSTAYDSFYDHGIKDFTPSKKQATLTMYDTLIQGFALDDSFFKDQTNLLLSLGIAYEASQHTDEQKLYRSEMFELMSNDLRSLPSGITDDQFTPSGGAADQQALKVFAKYKDDGLTNKLKQTLVNSGIFATVQKNLGLPNDDNLRTVHVQVMNFNAADNQQFSSEHNMFNATPTMWAERLDNEDYILLTKDYAQQFIDDPSSTAAYKIQHEFVHTQHAFVRGNLGRNIEERRAEKFSGDHSAYYDSKQLFIYVNVFSGIDIYEMLGSTPIDPNSFYVALYSKTGVSMANQIIASWPSAFLNQPPQAVTDTLQISNGLDGIIKSALQLGANDQTSVDARMKTRVDKLMSVFGNKQKVLQDVDYNLGQTYGMPTAAKKVRDYINSHY